MPRPTPGKALSRATRHLRKGNPGNKGRHAGVRLTPEEEKLDKKARAIANKLLERPKFKRSLEQRLDDMSLHPSVLVALMYYAWGKPKDTIEQKSPAPVRITHVFAKE